MNPERLSRNVELSSKEVWDVKYASTEGLITTWKKFFILRFSGSPVCVVKYFADIVTRLDKSYSVNTVFNACIKAVTKILRVNRCAIRGANFYRESRLAEILTARVSLVLKALSYLSSLSKLLSDVSLGRTIGSSSQGGSARGTISDDVLASGIRDESISITL